MLVPFVIDSDSLSRDQGWSASQYLVAHRLVQDVAGRFGLLIFDSCAYETSAIKQAVDRLPKDGVRHLWVQTLKEIPKLGFPGAWDGRVCSGAVGALEQTAQLALVDDTLAEVEFGFQAETLSKRVGNASKLEVCRLHAAALCERFREIGELAVSHIEPNRSHASVWAERFCVLATAPIKNIVIVDRYAISRSLEPAAGGFSGLECFLNLLDRHAGGQKYVTIFSSWTRETNRDGTRLEGIINYLTEVLRTLRNVKRVTVWMVRQESFSQISHDRFIRFGEHHVWDIGLGLRIFEGPGVRERSSAAFKAGVVAKEYRDVEGQLRVSKEAKSARVQA